MHRSILRRKVLPRTIDQRIEITRVEVGGIVPLLNPPFPLTSAADHEFNFPAKR